MIPFLQMRKLKLREGTASPEVARLQAQSPCFQHHEPPPTDPVSGLGSLWASIPSSRKLEGLGGGALVSTPNLWISDRAHSHALLRPGADRWEGQPRPGEWTYPASLPRDHQL